MSNQGTLRNFVSFRRATVADTKAKLAQKVLEASKALEATSPDGDKTLVENAAERRTLLRLRPGKGVGDSPAGHVDNKKRRTLLQQSPRRPSISKLALLKDISQASPILKPEVLPPGQSENEGVAPSVGEDAISLAPTSDAPAKNLSTTSRRSLRLKYAHLLPQKIVTRQNLISADAEAAKNDSIIDKEKHATDKNNSVDGKEGSKQESPYSKRVLPHLAELGTSPVCSLPSGSPALSVQNRIPHSKRVSPEQRVQLPASFEALDSLFSGLESTFTYLLGRGESVIFHRIKKTVETVSSRSFDVEHLRLIATIFPEAYDLQPIRIPHLGIRVDSYHIMFNPLWNRKRKRSESCSLQEHMNSTPGSFASGSNEKEANEMPTAISAPEFAAVDVPMRRKEFRRRLIAIVESAHTDFLLSAARSGPKEKCRFSGAWDPEFDLESVALPVARQDALPASAPRQLSQHVTEALDAIRQSRGINSITEKDSIFSSSTKKCNLISEKAKAATEESSQSTPSSTASRFSSLLERIRSKEKKIAEELVKEPTAAEKHRLTMLSRMPAVFASLKTIFQHGEKSTMPLNRVSQSVADSYPSAAMSLQLATDHVVLMAQIAPQFCAVVDIGSAKFVRVRIATSLSEIVQAVETAKLKIQDGSSARILKP